MTREAKQDESDVEESNFDAFKRKLEESGVTITLAADADPANAVRARKKLARRRLLEQATRGRVTDE